jgi:DNA/RNA endonuclease YhcR with UshA esterase domain
MSKIESLPRTGDLVTFTELPGYWRVSGLTLTTETRKPVVSAHGVINGRGQFVFRNPEDTTVVAPRDDNPGERELSRLL